MEDGSQNSDEYSVLNPVISIAPFSAVGVDKLLYCTVLYMYCTLNVTAITFPSRQVVSST